MFQRSKTCCASSSSQTLNATFCCYTCGNSSPFLGVISPFNFAHICHFRSCQMHNCKMWPVATDVSVA